MKSIFGQFQDVEITDALRENEMLEAHGLLVMTTIDDAITDINNVDKVEEMLVRTRNKHVGMTGFQNDFFWVRSLALCCIWCNFRMHLSDFCYLGLLCMVQTMALCINDNCSFH